MTLDAALASLRGNVARLQEALSALRVTVTEDAPRRRAVVLADRLDNLVTDMSSAVEEADAAVAHLLQIGAATVSTDVARDTLRAAHALLNRVAASYVRELAAYDSLAELLEMGRERGRGWREWAQEVKTAIGRCGAPLGAVAESIVECWSELAARAARGPVTVQATNIGQHITMRDDQLELAAKVT
jgi:hypothetical protein